MLKQIFIVLIGAAALCFTSHASYAAEPLAKIEGDLPAPLKDLLRDVLGEAEAPPRSLAQARRRVKKAAESAMSVMRSQGYYGAIIDARIIEAPNITDDKDAAQRTPPQGVLKITTGPQFTLQNFTIAYDGGSESENAPDIKPDIKQDILNIIQIKKGGAALSAKIIAAELQITNHLTANGYPDATALERKAIVDHDTKTMALTYNIRTGLKTRFGDIEQTGTAYLVKSWPDMVAPFKAGDDFDLRDLNSLSSRVLSTGSFKSATAILSDDAVSNDDGTVTRNVLLNIEQGPKNTISGEAGISTTDGSGVDLSYQRRNFIGYAQTLTLLASVKTNQISLGAHYNIPFANRVDRALDINGEIAREDTDAFTGERVGANALVTQKFSRRFRSSLGLGFEASQFEENGFETTSLLFEGLGRATYDSRNNILNPSKGVFIEADFIPTYNFGEEDGIFTAATLGASTYWKLSDKFTAAGRGKLGTIIGGNLATIPLNRRFFGGGGGSVRGFGFQSISPMNDQGDLTGGRSLSEVSAELRYKGESPFGFAAFVDAGSVTEREYPDFSDIRTGAGFGLRYHTSFAPLRADIAFPLNKREGDDAFQVYISIGQAF